MYPRCRLSRRSKWLEHNQCRSLFHFSNPSLPQQPKNSSASTEFVMTVTITGKGDHLMRPKSESSVMSEWRGGALCQPLPKKEPKGNVDCKHILVATDFFQASRRARRRRSESRASTDPTLVIVRF